ncbi:interferon-induced protein with tetratricopeptide repeats 5-like isoform X2 [Sardina pilchardus]|uniref:interferon-induced protein with tetratricopeptide repeats 5-like isoform X2 n=1 Tax=Sardina pilchardus TaxID=27697 RepID=UPI002E153C20
MNSSDDIPLDTKLQQLEQLECHFTWDLPKESADLSDLQTRLEDQIQLDLGKKAGAIRSYCFLAYVRYLQGFLDDALTNLLKSEELTKEYNGDDCERFLIVTYGNLAWLHYHRRSYSQCESYLEKLVGIKEKFPTTSPTELHPEVYGQKGWTYLKFAHKYKQIAKQCFEKALELEPDESEWNAGFGIALHRTESKKTRLEDSLVVKQLRRALEINPEDAVLMALLGLRLRMFQKHDEAERLIEEALDMDPSNPHVIRYVGKCFRQGGSVDRSIALLKRAVERTPNSCFLHHQLALCYRKKKDDLFCRGGARGKGREVRQLIAQCIHHLQLATTLKSNFILAMADLALHYGQNKEIDRAEEMFQETFKAAKENHDNVHIVHHYYGEFQQYQKKSQTLAIKHYKDCLTLGFNTVEGSKSARSLKKIAEKRLARYPRDGEAFEILEFVQRAKEAKPFDANNDECLSTLFDQQLSLQ